MAVLGTLLAGAVGGFGKKPRIPDLPQISPEKVQAETIAANQAALPGAQQLATGINSFNVAQRLDFLTKALSFAGGPGALGQVQSNIGAQLRGEIPTDVASQIQRNSAGKALQGGFGGGSALGRNLTARDFGLTSMGIQQQGLSNLTSFAGMADTPAFDYTSMFMSPQQRLEFAFKDRETKFNRELLHEQVSAAPDPFRAALGQAFIEDEKAIMELVGNVAGFAGGAIGCWVARAVYGNHDKRWRYFRLWLLTRAPQWLVTAYATYGPALAEVVKHSCLLRNLLRHLMDPIVNQTAQCYAR